MTDYGHELLFGSFITPTSAEPAQAVELATVSEQVGLDLVTFQDHPYQPSFLDTWTLMSFVAARTSTIRLSANVTNLPLRPPAVLARSIASLDLLSGGRVELGLGAGVLWDAIAGMGGRRLTAGESVRALAEAIGVIRSVWDTSARRPVQTSGEFYSVPGAQPGPAPAHDVAIWVGALKPRMLSLVGRLADGWLPSMSYLQPGDLTAGGRRVSEAAAQAGRAPGDVRRLLNVVGRFTAASRGTLQGPAEQWAEELTDLALTEGTSVFILASDDTDDLRRFGEEVAPAVRELVARERASGAVAGTPPQPDALPGGEPPPAHGPSGTAGGRLSVRPTPDDGSRRTSTQVWDESTRPVSPTPETGRTYAPAEQAGAQLLVDVHNTLRGELRQILDIVDQVAAGTTDVGAARSQLNAMTMRQNAWTLGAYCQSYSRMVTTHHLIEDRTLFPQLHRSVPEVAPVLDRLTDEHHTLHELLESVDQALIALVSAPEGISGLAAAVDLLTDALLSHLAYEERELVEPIARSGIVFG